MPEILSCKVGEVEHDDGVLAIDLEPVVVALVLVVVHLRARA